MFLQQPVEQGFIQVLEVAQEDVALQVGFLLPIFLVGPSGDLIYYNEPAEKILGCRFEETGEMSAQKWATMFRPQDEKGGSLTAENLPLVIAVNLRRPAHSACARGNQVRCVSEPLANASSSSPSLPLRKV